jgi:hypothetical protein
LEQLVLYAESKDLKQDNGLFKKYKTDLKMEIKANIADQLYGEVAYYKTRFSIDAMVQRAIKEINRTNKDVQPSAMNENENEVSATQKE